MDCSDENLENMSDIQQTVINKLYYMQWLKNNSQLPGHARTEVIAKLKHQKLNNITKTLLPAKDNNDKINTHQEIHETEVVQSDNISKRSHFPFGFSMSQTNMESILTEEEMLSCALQESLITAQLEEVKFNEKNVTDAGTEHNEPDSRGAVETSPQKLPDSSKEISSNIERQDTICNDNNNNTKDVSKIVINSEENTQSPDQNINKNRDSSGKQNAMENKKEKEPVHSNESKPSESAPKASSSQTSRSRFTVDRYGRTEGYVKFTFGGKGVRPQENEPIKKHTCTFTNSAERNNSFAEKKRIFTKRNVKQTLSDTKSANDLKGSSEKEEKYTSKHQDHNVKSTIKVEPFKATLVKQNNGVHTTNETKVSTPLVAGYKTSSLNSRSKINNSRSLSDVNKHGDNVSPKQLEKPKFTPNRKDSREIAKDQTPRVAKSKTESTIFRRSIGFSESKRYTHPTKTEQTKTPTLASKKKECSPSLSTPTNCKLNVKQGIEKGNETEINKISEIKVDADKVEEVVSTNLPDTIETTKPDMPTKENKNIASNTNINTNIQKTVVMPEKSKEVKPVPTTALKVDTNINNRSIKFEETLFRPDFVPKEKLQNYLPENPKNTPMQQSLLNPSTSNYNSSCNTSRQYSTNDSFANDRSPINLQSDYFVPQRMETSSLSLQEKPLLCDTNNSYSPSDMKNLSQYYPSMSQVHGSQSEIMQPSRNNISQNMNDVNMIQNQPISDYKPPNLMIPSSNFCNYPLVPNQWNLPTQDVMYPTVLQIPHPMDMQNLQNLQNPAVCYNNNGKNYVDPNYMPRQMVCIPMPCMHSWDSHMKYMNPMFQNPQNNAYDVYQNQLQPQPQNTTPSENIDQCFSMPPNRQQYQYMQQQQQQQQPIHTSPTQQYQQTPPASNNSGNYIRYKPENYQYSNSQRFKNHPQSGNGMPDVKMNSDQYRKPNVSNTSSISSNMSHLPTKQERYPFNQFNPAVPPPFTPSTERIDTYGAQRNVIPNISPNFRNMPPPSGLRFNIDSQNSYNRDTVDNELNTMPIISPKDCMNYGANFPQSNNEFDNSNEQAKLNSFKKSTPRVGFGRGRFRPME